MPKVYTTISQWGLVSGIRQVQSDMIVVNAPRSPFSSEARKGQLFIVVEAEGDIARGRQACALVAQTICQTFYADGSMSITSSLRHAIKAANAALYQHNFDAPPHKRALVGATCAVVHDGNLYLTQVPPAQAFVSHTAKLRALPLPLTWNNGAHPITINRQGSLGTSLGSEPEFSRSLFKPGDALVLCSSNLARLMSKHQTEQLICYSDAITIAEELYGLCRAANLPEAHAIVIEATAEPPTADREPPIKPVVAADGPKPKAERWSGWLGRTPREPRRRVDDVPATAPKGPATSTLDVPGPTPLTQALPAVPLTVIDTLPVAEVVPLPASAFLGEGSYGGTVRPPAVPRRNREVDLSDNNGTPVDFAALPRRPVPPPPSLGERLTLPFRTLMMMALGTMSNVPRRTARAAEQKPAQGLKLKGLSYRRQRPPLPWFNIVLIVGIVTLLIVVGMQQNRRRDTDTVTRALEGVSTAVAAARQAPDDRAAQERLTAAEAALNGEVADLVDSGLITTTKPLVWSRYLEVRRSYDQAMAAINRIGFLEDFETVATLPGGQGLVDRIVLGATTSITETQPLFYLDRAAGVLYQQGSEAPLLRPNQDISGFTIQPIREVLWREGNVIAFDRGDVLFPIYRVFLRNGDGWLVNKLNQTEHMEPAEGNLPMATFAGHLYVWDSKVKQLWKYGSGLYADLPTGWITNAGDASLERIVDVQIDGLVYLLSRDGRVLVFEGGQLIRQFEPPKLTIPLTAVARFIVTPDVIGADGQTVEQPGYIYLLDTRNERVLQLSKTDGSLIQQMQARSRGPLNQLTDLAVDETRRVLYLANGSRVIRAALPEPAQLAVDEEETNTVTTEQ